MSEWIINPTSGNDSTGNGTTLPWKTFQKAHDMATGGDTIIVESGVHTLTVSDEVLLTKSLIIAGETDVYSDTIIDGGEPEYRATLLFNANSISLAVSGLTFRNMSGGEYSYGILGWHQNYNKYSCSLSVERCAFFDCAMGTHKSFIRLAQTSGFDVLIDRCVYDDKVHTELRPFYGLFPTDVDFVMRNSIFRMASSSGYGLLYFLEMQGTLGFYNNHIENDGSSCPMIYSGNVTPTFHNNNTQGSWSSIPTGTGNISVDPLFVDPDNYDFHIGRGSPLINAGAFS